ncbi:restriction endonuclease subunit S [Chloroflexota bacterium]
MTKTPIQKQNLLPSGWQDKPLGDVMDIRNGYAFKSIYFTAGGVLLIRQSNLTTNGISTNKPIYLPESYLKKYAGYKVSKGDVLIGMSGSIGKLCVYDLDTPALQNQRTGLVKFLAPELKEYITCYLRYIENELLALSKGEAVKNISVAQIKSCIIPLPPIRLAQRIAAKIQSLLTELDAATESLKTVKTNLNNYRNAVLKKALYVKQNVKSVRLSEVAYIMPGYSFSSNISTKDGATLPFFKVADLATTDGYRSPYLSDARHYISANDSKKLNLKPLKCGTIVFAKTGEAIKLNRRGILKQEALIDNNMMGVISASTKLDNMYLYYLLLSTRLVKLSRATTVPSIRKNDIANISIPLPPVSEQSRIAHEIEDCFASATSLEKAISDNIRQSVQLQQSIFTRAFAGKLIVS